ncbi:MAG: alpha/beta fold hydrolase [Acidimicrobiales bacterium]
MTLPWELRADEVPLRGDRFWGFRRGEGAQAIVLLHASICDSRIWRPLGDLMGADDVVLYGYDRPGFGGTPAPSAPHSVEDLLEVIDTEGLERVTLVGNSMGGGIALAFAALHPERVERLVVIAPALPGAPELDTINPLELACIARYEAAQGSSNDDELVEVLLEIWLDGPLFRAPRVIPALRDQLRVMLHPIARRLEQADGDLFLMDLDTELAHLPMPVLSLVGSLDFSQEIANAERVARRARRGRNIVLADRAHLPHFEDPSSVRELLVEFCATT